MVAFSGTATQTLQRHVQSLTARLHKSSAGGEAEQDLAFPLDARELAGLCSSARDAFLKEPCLLELPGGMVIVGDIHGQFGDLLNIFLRQGFPPDTCYLFLGDFIDRGIDGLEVMALLMAYKLLYPCHVYLLRGNHECSFITLMYGFYAECLRKMSEDAWTSVCSVFDALPVAARVGGRILCMHGGISPQLRELSDINAIQRPTALDTEDGGLLTDLVWSDPSHAAPGFIKNSRGAGWLFGGDALGQFNRDHKLDMIVRAHETVQTGWAAFEHNALFTVFSAPDYQGLGNTGATMTIQEDLSYSFEMYEPQSKPAPSSPQNPQHLGHLKASEAASSHAMSGTSDTCSYCIAAAPPPSPFAAAQAEQHVLEETCGVQEMSCRHALFSFDYCVPASPFACVAACKAADSSAGPECAGSYDVGSFRTSLSGNLLNACSQGLREHPSVLSHQSTAAMALAVSGV